MGTRQQNREQLRLLLANPDQPDELANLLLLESRLPGPRANLELAGDVALVTHELRDKHALQPLFRSWLETKTFNHPAAEYLPFCAVYGLGGLYLDASESDRETIEALLRKATNSENWRIREAVTLALQFVGERDAEAMMAVLRGWSFDATLLEVRAIVATIAHPPILALHPEIAVEGLGMVDNAINRVHELPPARRKQEPFKVLVKGLGFALSVIVAAAPEVGFALMRQWAGSNDADVAKILKENLRKDRLTKRFPDETASVERLLNGDRR